MSNPEDELRDATIQKWNELKERIERNTKKVEEKEQELSNFIIRFEDMNKRLVTIEENIKKGFILAQTQTNNLNNEVIEAIKRIKEIDGDKLKHISELFIRKAVEIRLGSLDKEFQEETKKQLQPLINSMKEQIHSNLNDMYKQTVYAKKFFRDMTKQEKTEVIKIKKETIKKQKTNKSKQEEKMEDDAENDTKTVTPEPNSI